MIRPSTTPSKRCSSPPRISEMTVRKRAFEVFQQQAIIGREVVAVGGVTGRVHARGAAQRLDLQPRIVGEAVEPGAAVEVVRLLRGVAFEGLLLLGNILLNAAVAGRQQGEGVAQHSLHFGELVGVIRGENDFHGMEFFVKVLIFPQSPKRPLPGPPERIRSVRSGRGRPRRRARRNRRRCRPAPPAGRRRAPCDPPSRVAGSVGEA